MAKTSKANLKAAAKYNQKFDRVVFRLPLGEKEKLTEYANNKGLSVNQYIIGLIKKDMQSGG